MCKISGKRAYVELTKPCATLLGMAPRSRIVSLRVGSPVEVDSKKP